MLDYSIAKKWKWYCQYCLILWEKLKIMSKNPKCLWEITSRFLRGRERTKATGHVGVSCENLGKAACTSENYSNFKSKFLFNNESIFEIYYYLRTRGNARFNDFSQLINALSNQGFAVLDNLDNL